MKVVILTEEQAALIAEFITGPGKFCASQPCTPSDEPINGEPCIYKQNKLLPLLTPVEIPEGEARLVEKIIMLFADEAITQALAKAAALITAYSRTVPRAIDAIAGKLEEAIGEEDWNEAKSVLNDLWDLRDDGYKVEG